jgi:SHOCT-like domain
MKQQTTPVNSKVKVMLTMVPGDLQVVGWERSELMAKTDGNKLEQSGTGGALEIACDADLILYVPRDASLNIKSVGGDADLRALVGFTKMTGVGGDLSLRNIGPMEIDNVGGDLSLRGCSGDFYAKNIGSDASLREVQGSISIDHVGSDLYLRGARGDVAIKAGSDAVLYLQPKAAVKYAINAGSDVLLRLPAQLDAELVLQGGSSESIRIDLPGIEAFQEDRKRTLVLGSGLAKISVLAGNDVVVTSQADEWESMAEFDGYAREDAYTSGEIYGLPADLHERINRKVQEATQRATEKSMRAQERAQARADAAIRRAEGKMRAHDRRMKSGGVIFRGAGVGPERPTGPTPPADQPISDEERLTILRMLQDKKISLDDAEKLLSALEGK